MMFVFFFYSCHHKIWYPKAAWGGCLAGAPNPVCLFLSLFRLRSNYNLAKTNIQVGRRESAMHGVSGLGGVLASICVLPLLFVWLFVFLFFSCEVGRSRGWRVAGEGGGKKSCKTGVGTEDKDGSQTERIATRMEHLCSRERKQQRIDRQ